MSPRGRLILLGIVAATTLTGCRGRADLTIAMRPDGSGEVAVATALDQGAPDLLSDAIAEPAPPGTRVEPWEADGLEGTRFVTSFSTPGQLESFLNVPGASPLVDAQASADDFEITVDLPALVEAMAGEPLARAASASAPQDIASHVSLTFSLDLPGRVVQHNADRVEGTALVWDLVGRTEPARARARIGDDRSLPRAPPWAWVSAGLAVTGMATGLARRRRRHGDGV